MKRSKSIIRKEIHPESWVFFDTEPWAPSLSRVSHKCFWYVQPHLAGLWDQNAQTLISVPEQANPLPAPYPHESPEGTLGTWQVSPCRCFTHQGNQAEFSQREAVWGHIVKLGCSNSCESYGYKFQAIAIVEPFLPPPFFFLQFYS